MATTPNHSPPFTSRAKGGPRYSLSLINIPLSILPLSTRWNLSMRPPFVYAKVYQSSHAPSEYMLKPLFYWSLLSMLPLTVSKVCKRCSTRRKWLYLKWPSYHQRLIHTSISQTSEDIQILTHPPNQVGLHLKFTHDKQVHYIIHPRHSGETKIGRYMTLITKDIYAIETKYLEQDYESHQ